MREWKQMAEPPQLVQTIAETQSAICKMGCRGEGGGKDPNADGSLYVGAESIMYGDRSHYMC